MFDMRLNVVLLDVTTGKAVTVDIAVPPKDPIIKIKETDTVRGVTLDLIIHYANTRGFIMTIGLIDVINVEEHALTTAEIVIIS